MTIWRHTFPFIPASFPSSALGVLLFFLFLDFTNTSAAADPCYKSPMFNSYLEQQLCSSCALTGCVKKARGVVHNTSSKLAPWYDCASHQTAFGRSAPLSPVGTVSPSFKFNFPPHRLSSGASCERTWLTRARAHWNERLTSARGNTSYLKHKNDLAFASKRPIFDLPRLPYVPLRLFSPINTMLLQSNICVILMTCSVYNTNETFCVSSHVLQASLC